MRTILAMAIFRLHLMNSPGPPQFHPMLFTPIHRTNPLRNNSMKGEDSRRKNEEYLSESQGQIAGRL